MTESKTVTVSILDKDYQINCGEDEVAVLQQSAQYVDEKMREIKTSSNVFGLDRLAVMAALNIANDLISQTNKTKDVVDHQKNDLQSLNGKLDLAINRLKSAQN
ncbi:MAG: cell division protein ZapA [Pseudomonadales bacterium]